MVVGLVQELHPKGLIPKEKTILSSGDSLWVRQKWVELQLRRLRGLRGLKICNFLPGVVYISESAEEGSFEW